MNAAIESNSSELLQNNTVSFVNKYLNSKDQNYTLHKIE